MSQPISPVIKGSPPDSPVIAERTYDNSIEQIVHIGSDWYRLVLIKDRKPRECEPLSLTEARRLLLMWGRKPEDVVRLTGET